MGGVARRLDHHARLIERRQRCPPPPGRRSRHEPGRARSRRYSVTSVMRFVGFCERAQSQDSAVKSKFWGGSEQPRVLAQGKAVGHPGDEIRDPARARRRLGARRAPAAHSSGMNCGCTKKRANSSRTTSSALVITSMHARMPVHVGPEELLDGAVGRRHQRPRSRPARLPAARTSSAEVGASSPMRRTLSASTSSISRPIRRRTSSWVSRRRIDAGILRRAPRATARRSPARRRARRA